MNQFSNFRQPFSGMRILICGKGGCGKSSFVTLMSRVLATDKGYNVVVLDGDASNPGGLARLMFGLKKPPVPLIELFGGRKNVECPVDDPAPLTRLNDESAITENNIDFSEIPSKYFVRKENIVLFQTGKIEESYEGCDGPMSKVNRDFVVKGDYVTLIDVEAGIEHFGRGVEMNIDIVMVIADPTYESCSIAEKVAKLCGEMGINKVYTILNKVQSKNIETVMAEEMKKRKVGILGVMQYDQDILKAGLMGTPLDKCEAAKDVKRIIEKLEETVS
jgi:CO dehydrogenase maturation factor